MLFDVEIQVPVGGPKQWVELIKSVPAESVEEIKEVLVWPVRCAEATPTETEDFATPATTKLIPATEYNVWMQYPPLGDKFPWGLIADRVSPETAQIFLKNTARKVSVMPRR